MPLVKKRTANLTPKRGKRVPATVVAATSRRKSPVVVIDGVEVELRPVKGKGVLKRADIVRAVKKVISARVEANTAGGNKGGDE